MSDQAWSGRRPWPSSETEGLAIQARAIAPPEYTEAYLFQCQYLDLDPWSAFLARIARHPDLYLVALAGNRVVGVCYGSLSPEREGWATLEGIAVDLGTARGYARKGIGTRLLRTFEKAVLAKGAVALGVGSAEDPGVERFYFKNGFHPVELVAKGQSREELARVAATDYREGCALRAGLKERYHAHEVIWIFEKRLGD
ncbi:MAG: GNAT family N-acetyltransferase [Firmicutes bacterium]|nr:GNAT family N-acetyltransferase [Bacillota bacterium]